MSHNVCHNVTNSVSHRCPDQTRPDQTVFRSVRGLSMAEIHSFVTQVRATKNMNEISR